MTLMCAACKERGKTWRGDDPKCAFQDGRMFNPDNWNCATVGMLRDVVYEGQDLPACVDYQYCDDMKYATVLVDGFDVADGAMAAWVAWYKSRGRTDAIWLLYSDQPPRRPTEAECLAIVEAAQAQTPKKESP